MGVLSVVSVCLLMKKEAAISRPSFPSSEILAVRAEKEENFFLKNIFFFVKIPYQASNREIPWVDLLIFLAEQFLSIFFQFFFFDKL